MAVGEGVGELGISQREHIDQAQANEHVLYAPKIQIVPDTHGLDPAHYGISKESKDVISIGDIIDAPKNLHTLPIDDASIDKYLEPYFKLRELKTPYTPEEKLEIKRKTIELRTKENNAANSVDIRKSVEVWSHLLETDQGQLVLGNHELMALSGFRGNDQDLTNWLIDRNKGTTTLEAFGISLTELGIDIPRLEPDPFDSSGEKMIVSNKPSARQLKLIRDKMQNTPELARFFDLIQSKGKMYTIANEALVVHAGVSVDSKGNLISPQRKGAAWPGFENLVGLDALDAIENGIKAGDKDILHMAASGSAKEMSPAWMREPFFKVMRDEEAAKKIMASLSEQAKKRGTDIQVIAIGHSEAVGGGNVGNFVLGTDTGIGDVVTLEASAAKQVKVLARHNFRQRGEIVYGLTNSVPTEGDEKSSSEVDDIDQDFEKLLNIEQAEDREGNNRNLADIKNALTAQYDIELADAVVNYLTAQGYEGTAESGFIANNIEESLLPSESESLITLGVAALVMSNILPNYSQEFPLLSHSVDMSDGDFQNLPEERQEQYSNEMIRLIQLIYKGSRATESDLSDPLVGSVNKLLTDIQSSDMDSFISRVNETGIGFATVLAELPAEKVKAYRLNNLNKYLSQEITKLLADQIIEDRILYKNDAAVIKPVVETNSRKKIRPTGMLKMSLVSVYGDVGGERVETSLFGRDHVYNAEARETLEVGVERAAALAETETRSKWATKRKEGQTWLSYVGEVAKNNVDRAWRSMFSDKLHHAKEIRHALRIMGEAGVENGLTAEFISKVDVVARARLEADRAGMSKWDQFKAKTKDFFSEVVGREKDLHEYRAQVVREWREKFDQNPLDAKENPIYDLVMSDLESREAIAKRVAESTQETLHLSGESKSVQSIIVSHDSKLGEFLNREIFSVAVKDALARKKNGDANAHLLSPKLKVDLDKKLNNFFQTQDFDDWKKSLPEDQQKLLPDVFTYASDILSQVEGSLIPTSLEQSSHSAGMNRNAIDIELMIGIAQYGPNGEIKTGTAERSRLKNEVLNKMRERKPAYSAEDIDGGIKRALILENIDEWVNNPLGAAIAGFIGGKLIFGVASHFGGVVGTATGGAIRTGFREWAKLKAERNELNIEKTLGYKRAKDAKKAMQLEQFLTRSVVASEEADAINLELIKVKEGNVTDEGVTKLVSLVVNGEARISLGRSRGINLVAAKDNGGDELSQRQNYQHERRLYDLSRAEARAQLKSIAITKPDVWKKLSASWGFSPEDTVDKVLQDLRIAQENNLLDGTKLDIYESVLGTISVAEQDSVKGKDKAFNFFRLKTATTHAVVAGLVSGAAAYGLSELASTEDYVSTTTETVKETLVSPHLPLHVDNIDGGIGQVGDTTMHAYIPEGMHLMPIATHHSGNTEYALYLDHNNTPVVEGLQIGHDGLPHITPAVQQQLTAHGLSIHPQTLPSETINEALTQPDMIPTPDASHIPETYTIRLGDLDGREGGGVWDWMMHSIRGENPDVGINQQTNAAYKLFRAYENMRGNNNFVMPDGMNVNTVTTSWDGSTMHEVLPAYNNDNLIINDLPALFATPEGHQLIADHTADAIRMHEAGQSLDRFHQLLYTLAVNGDRGMPNAEDTKFIVDHFASLSEQSPVEIALPPVEIEPTIVTPHNLYITVDKAIVQEVACTVKRETVDGVARGLPVFVSWRKNLESPENTTAPKPLPNSFESNSTNSNNGGNGGNGEKGRRKSRIKGDDSSNNDGGNGNGGNGNNNGGNGNGGNGNNDGGNGNGGNGEGIDGNVEYDSLLPGSEPEIIDTRDGAIRKKSKRSKEIEREIEEITKHSEGDKIFSLTDADKLKDAINAHLESEKAYVDFVEREYEHIAQFFNVENLSANEVKAMLDAIANEPGIQAVLQSVLVGFQTLPSEYRKVTSRYETIKSIIQKDIASLDKKLGIAKSRRIASIFDEDFARKFNGEVKWAQSEQIRHTLDTIPPRAEATLHIPDNAEFDTAKLLSTIDEQKQLIIDNAGVDAEDQLEERISEMQADLAQKEANKEGMGSAWTKEHEKPLKKLSSKLENIKKAQQRILLLESYQRQYDSKQNRSLTISTYHMSAYNDKKSGVPVPEKKGISPGSLELLNLFKINNDTLGQEYIFDPNTKIEWSFKGNVLDSEIPSRDVHIEFELPKYMLADGESEPPTIRADLHFVDDAWTPDEKSLEILKKYRLWDERNGHKPVSSTNENEAINYSPAEVEDLEQRIESLKTGLLPQIEAALLNFGGTSNQNSLLSRVNRASDSLTDATFNHRETLIGQIMEKEREQEFPYAYGIVEDADKFTSAFMSNQAMDLLLGFALMARGPILDKLPPRLRNKISSLQKKVNLIDIAYLRDPNFDNNSRSGESDAVAMLRQTQTLMIKEVKSKRLEEQRAGVSRNVTHGQEIAQGIQYLDLFVEKNPKQSGEQ